MNPLPLLLREFQVALRRPLTLRLRLAFGVGSMLLVIWSILVAPDVLGARIFPVLVAIGAVLSIAVAVFGASDSVSCERREGTLGFLFLTDLRAGDVILGKFAAAGLVPIYTLLSMFPAYAVCLLVGGVPVAVFWKSILALIVTLVFSLCATIWVSTLCEDHRKAFGGAAALLLVLNPLWLCWSALRGGTGGFFLWTVAFTTLAFLFFRAAASGLQRHWRDPEKGFVAGSREKVVRCPKTSAMLETVPVAWMMLRRRNRRSWTRWLLAMAYALALSPLVVPAALPPTPGMLILNLWILFGAHVAYQFGLLTRTAYAFYWDRKSGALELMLGSRLSNEEIFRGFNSFLLRRSAPAILLIAEVDVVYAVLLWVAGAGAIAVLPLAMAVVQGIVLSGVGWLGVYRSLMMNHPSLAILATYARLALVPVILSLLFLSVPQTDFFKVAAFYIISSAFLAAFFSMDAKTALMEHGRALLLRPATEKPPHIENEWSFIDWEEADLANAQPVQSV